MCLVSLRWTVRVTLTPQRSPENIEAWHGVNFWCFLCCRHILIKKLSALRDSEPELAQLLADQVSVLQRLLSCLFSKRSRERVEAGSRGPSAGLDPRDPRTLT